MNIQWSITKKRGNLRPLLNYTITLNEFEKGLAMPAVRIESTIPKPPDAGWEHCWPGQNERAPWTPAEFHLLMTPSHRAGETTGQVKLPWRESNEYPEVKQSFLALRDAFETALAQAAASAPLHEEDTLEASSAAKKTIAPAYAAERLLQVVKG